MKNTQLRKYLFVVVILMTIVSMLVACAPASQSTESVATKAQSTTAPEATTEVAAATTAPEATTEVAAATTAATEEVVSSNSSSNQVVNVLLDSHPWQKAIEKHIQEFTDKTGIKVNITVVGEDAYWDRVSLGLSSDIPPFDVFMLSPNMTGYTGYTNNWIAQLDDYLNNSTLTPSSYNFNDIYPYISNGFRFPDSNGKLYGIPLTMETYMLFYRKDLFQEQNIDVSMLKNVDDWMAALDKIQAAYKDQGISAAVIRGQDPSMPDELLAAVYDYWGNRSFLPQRMFYFDQNWVPQFTDPAVVNGFKLWAKLIDYGPVGSTSFSWNDAVRQFADGKAATYWFDASVFGSIFEDPEQSSVVGKVGYSVVPPTATGHGTTHWAWGLSIPEKAQNKDNAWKFIEWATSPEIEMMTAPSTYGPVRASTWASVSDKFGSEFASAVDQSLKISVPGYMYFPGSGEIVDRIIDAVVKISQGEDPEKTMQTLNDQAADIVKQQGLSK